MSDFVWPSDNARAASPELDRVCDYLEDTLDKLDALRALYESTKAELEKARARVAELERDVEELEALRAPVILRKQAEAVAFSAHLFPEAEQASIRRALYDYAETLRQQAEAAGRTGGA